MQINRRISIYFTDCATLLFFGRKGENGSKRIKLCNFSKLAWYLPENRNALKSESSLIFLVNLFLQNKFENNEAQQPRHYAISFSFPINLSMLLFYFGQFTQLSWSLIVPRIICSSMSYLWRVTKLVDHFNPESSLGLSGLTAVVETTT